MRGRRGKFPGSGSGELRVGFKNRKRKNWGQSEPRKDVLWLETRRLGVKDQS